MNNFTELMALYKKGHLKGQILKDCKRNTAEDLKLDNRKHFKLKDGSEIDLTQLDTKEHPKQRLLPFTSPNPYYKGY